MVARLLLLLFALATIGCKRHILGTNDIEVDFVVETPAGEDGSASEPPMDRETLRRRIESRLSAGRITADVEVGDGVRVVVDRAAATGLVDLLTWRGGLEMFEIDYAVDLAPAEGTSIERETLPDGSVARYLLGSNAAVWRAAEEAKVGADHAVLLGRIDHERVRSYVVRSPPLAVLDRDVDRVDFAGGGHDLAFQLSARGLERARAALAAKPGATFAVVRGHSVISARPLDAASLVPLRVHFGDDLFSYERAQRVERIFATRRLPPLRHTGTFALSTNWNLVSACIALPLFVSLAWLWFVRRFDRGKPEPYWLVLATFALGAAIAPLAGVVEASLARASPYLDPDLMMLGGQVRAFPGAFLVFTICVGIPEEGAKLLGAWVLARHRREFDEPIDGIVYAAASALGFAATENLRYLAMGRLSTTMIAARAFSAVPAHVFFASIWGYAMGKKLVSKRTSLLLAFLLAATLHGFSDTVLGIEGLDVVCRLVEVISAAIFIGLLRRALQWGPVASGEAPASVRGRVLIRIGGPAPFSAFFAAFLGAEYLLIERSASLDPHRIDFASAAVAGVVFLALGILAGRVAASIPLDAAIDDRGVTYRGILRAWSTITGYAIDVHRGLLETTATVRVISTAGDLAIGPGTTGSIERVVEEVRCRLPGGSKGVQAEDG